MNSAAESLSTEAANSVRLRSGGCYALPSSVMRRVRVVLLATTLIITLVVPVGDKGNVAAGSAVASVLAAIKAPFAFFAQRSPGGRGTGALLQTKSARLAGLDGPHERVLSGIRDRELAPGLPSGADTFAPAAASPLDGFPDLVGGAPGSETAGSGGASPSEFDPSPFPNSSFGTPPLLPPPDDFEIVRGTPPVSPVPESSDWILLILGFSVVGCALRRTKAKWSKV